MAQGARAFKGSRIRVRIPRFNALFSTNTDVNFFSNTFDTLNDAKGEGSTYGLLSSKVVLGQPSERFYFVKPATDSFACINQFTDSGQSGQYLWSSNRVLGYTRYNKPISSFCKGIGWGTTDSEGHYSISIMARTIVNCGGSNFGDLPYTASDYLVCETRDYSSVGSLRGGSAYTVLYLDPMYWGRQDITTVSAYQNPMATSGLSPGMTSNDVCKEFCYRLKLYSPEYIAKYAAWQSIESYIPDSYDPQSPGGSEDLGTAGVKGSNYWVPAHESISSSAQQTVRPSTTTQAKTWSENTSVNVFASRADRRALLNCAGIRIRPQFVAIKPPEMTAMADAGNYQRKCTIKNPNPISLVLFYSWRKQTTTSITSVTQWACKIISPNSTTDIYVTDASGGNDHYLHFFFSGTCGAQTSTSSLPTTSTCKAFDVYTASCSFKNQDNSGTSRPFYIPVAINSFPNSGTTQKASSSTCHRITSSTSLTNPMPVVPNYKVYSIYNIDAWSALTYSLYSSGTSGSSYN